MGKYRFNREQLKFVEDKIGLKGWTKRAVKYFVLSVLMAVLYYGVISLFVNTEEERRLARENAVMEEEYVRLQEKIEVLDNTVKNLQVKDREIYRQIFDADPPTLSHSESYETGFFEGIDTTRNDLIIEYSRDKIVEIEREARRVGETILSINRAFSQAGEHPVTSIPSVVPLRGFSIGQTGASVGQKINPFFKTVATHNGIDLLGATGADVLAAADGVATLVSRKGKKEGNVVEITHGNGYVTKYMMLGDILVRQGQKVNQGTVIGRVGMSGMSFAPHLHYEVIYNGAYMDPIHYFFADLTPALFKEMVVITSNTGQSLD